MVPAAEGGLNCLSDAVLTPLAGLVKLGRKGSRGGAARPSGRGTAISSGRGRPKACSVGRAGRAARVKLFVAPKEGRLR